MVNQTTTKPIGLIYNMKILVHELPYVMTFIVLHNNLVDANDMMLLSRPWLWDVKILHDWGNNLVTIQGDSIVITIDVTKHLGNDTKGP
jgi:hypothetical protein